jgi:cytochrome c-type biogenesis protein CcmH/NrfG
MASITLASIYEQQGHKKEALSIYKSLYKDNPNNVDIKKAIKRLQGKRISKVSYFANMHTKEQFDKFERWLVTGWN